MKIHFSFLACRFDFRQSIRSPTRRTDHAPHTLNRLYSSPTHRLPSATGHGSSLKGSAFITVPASLLGVMSSRRLEAELLGKIVFARFLERPLRTFDRLVRQLEASPVFSALREAAVVLDRLAGARAVEPGPVVPATLGTVVVEGSDVDFVYHSTSYTREYRFEESVLRRGVFGAGADAEITRAVYRLHLVNSRNRLTHALVRHLLHTQAPYLRGGDPLALHPLTQAALSARLRSDARLDVVADAGRLSRLIRALLIRLPTGKEIRLRTLCPTARQVHCYRLGDVVKNEKTLILRGVFPAPLTDEALARHLQRTFGVRVSRRTVASLRRELGIPAYGVRCRRQDYLTATAGFSSLLPLTVQTLRNAVPAQPGIYELRVDGAQPAPCGVIYIGGTGNLYKRLSDHLRGSSGNARLRCYLATGGMRLRFRVVTEGWRQAERELYQVFCESFAAAPACNRMRP